MPCHQRTVYEASAIAAPLLFEAAKSPNITGAERDQLLALVVHIGLGEDTTWRGYTSWEVVEDCARAVQELLPDFVVWAAEGTPQARRWMLALAAQHPGALAALKVDPDQFMRDVDPAVADLVRHAVTDTLPDEGLIHQVVALDSDLHDYYTEVLSELPPQQRARRIVLELAITERL